MCCYLFMDNEFYSEVDSRIVLFFCGICLLIGFLMGYLCGYIHSSLSLTESYNELLRYHYSPMKLNSTAYMGSYFYTDKLGQDYSCYLLLPVK